jgi:1,4-alpha-glucan branching enzyme
MSVRGLSRARHVAAGHGHAEGARMVRVEKRPGWYERAVHFEIRLPASARTVMLVGDFNHWNWETDAMERAGAMTWQRVVLLVPGQYAYQYLVNQEQWMADPDAPETVPNTRGGRSSLIRVT